MDSKLSLTEKPSPATSKEKSIDDIEIEPVAKATVGFIEPEPNPVPTDITEQAEPSPSTVRQVKTATFAPLTTTGSSFSRWSDELIEADEEIQGHQEAQDQGLFKHDSNYDKLYEIYNSTIAGLDQSETQGINLEPVKYLFRLVWDGLEKSHSNAMRLQHKDHEISVELSTTMAKTRTLVKLAENDPQIAQRLKSKLENAWSLADIGEEEERKNSIKIAELKDDIATLNRSIKAAAKTEGQETIIELNKIKSQLEADKNAKLTEVYSLQSVLDQLDAKFNHLTEMKEVLAEKMEMLNREDVVQKEAIERESLRKEKLVIAIEETLAMTEQRHQELKDLEANLNMAETRLAEADKNLKEQRLLNEEAQRDMELSNNRHEKMKQDYEAQVKLCERLEMDFFKKQADLRAREDEVLFTRIEISRANRQKELNLEKVSLYQTSIEGLETEREVLKEKLLVLEGELEIAQKKLAENKKRVESLDKDRSLLNRTLQRATAIANEHVGHEKTHELAVRNLEVEVVGYEKEIGEQQDTISRLERERDAYSHEASKLAHHVAVNLEEVKKLDAHIFEYRKKLGEIETQVKKQQQLYESALYDKSMLQRSLRDTLHEAAANTIKIGHMGHDILILKFRLAQKDGIIHREAGRYERVLKETQFYAAEANRISRMAHDMQRMVEALESERGSLGVAVAEAESEIAKQNYYATNAAARAEVYIRKYMTKDQELRDVWDKWRVLLSTIRIGAYHFRNVVAEIRDLRFQIFQMKKEKLVVRNAGTNINKLKNEIATLERIISKETCMCNSLRDSMRHRVNVHRWRVLECTDPNAFEMVQKVNILTKRLVSRNSTLTEQAKELQYKQELYRQIREVLSKAPGLEPPENVNYYKSLLSAKKQQYSKLCFELKAAESQSEYYEEEIRHLNHRLEQIKQLYFKRMKTGKHGQSQICMRPSKQMPELQWKELDDPNEVEFLGEDDDGPPKPCVEPSKALGLNTRLPSSLSLYGSQSTVRDERESEAETPSPSKENMAGLEKKEKYGQMKINLAKSVASTQVTKK